MSAVAYQPFGAAAPDGRAACIVRGVQLMLAESGWTSLTEVSLASGRRADLMALGPRGEVQIMEVKSCLQDFRTDRKWPEYAPWCDSFLFAVDCDFPQAHLPEDAGLIVADSFGGAVVRPPALMERLASARRRAITLAFGRLAASRLMRTAEGLQSRADSEPAID